MNDYSKIKIALEFVGLHKTSDFNEWSPLPCHVNITDKQKLIIIYNNLEQGVYGDLEHISGQDYQVEISSDDSASHLPVPFVFETELDRSDVDEIEFLSKDQLWEQEQTRYWFSVCNTSFCVADTNGELQLLDHRGRPCRECDATDAILASLVPHYELHIQD